MGYHITMNLSGFQPYLGYSPAQFQTYQLAKLKTFVSQIRVRSRYYRKILAPYPEIRTYEQFETLPWLDQDALRNTDPDEMRGAAWSAITTVSASSGTTGKSKLVLWTRSALREEAKWNALEYLLMGVTPASRLAMLMPLELSRCPSYLEACRVIGAFSVPFGRIRNDVEMDNVISKMHLLNVSHIHGSTSRLLSLTQRAKELGYDLKKDFAVTHLFGSALFVSANTRAFLEEEWGAEFFDCYGANEVSFISGECSRHDGLHLLPGISYVEVVDPKTRKRITDSTTPGEILVTNFSNSGSPLLRYRIGDTGTITYRPCSCGLAFPRLFVRGRTAFTLYIGGTKLDAYDIDSVLGKFPAMSNNYQAVIQHAGSSYDVRFRVESLHYGRQTPAETDALLRALESASYEINLKVREGNVRFTLELVPLGSLPRSDRDKILDQVLYQEG